MSDIPNLFLSKGNALADTVLSKYRKPMPATAPIEANSGSYQMDLSFENTYATFNSGYKVLLNIVHVQSRFLYSFLLKNKSDCADKLITILPTLEPKVTVLAYDSGLEFVNNKLQNFLNNNGIISIVSNKHSKTGASSTSLSIVERVNATIRMLIERYIAYAVASGLNKGTSKFSYINAYPLLIKQYNNSIHRSLGMTPADALAAILDPKNNIKNIKLLIKIQTEKMRLGADL